MKKIYTHITIVTLVMLSFIVLIPDVHADDKGSGKKTLSKTNVNDHIQTIDINDIEYFLSNNGKGATDPDHDDAQGFYYPKGTTGSAIYQDGFVWSGYVELPDGSSNLRSGGATYVAGLQAGKIVTSGSVSGTTHTPAVADDPGLAKYRIFKVRKDWQNETDPVIKAQLEKDYNEWPWQDGAPYDTLTNGTKVPRFLGDEMLWFVSNDLDVGRSDDLYGSEPIGIEVQTLVFAFKQAPFNSMIFMKRKFINKSGLTISNMYVSQWSDPDLGGASDDVVGVDRDLKLGYCYNGDANDAVYGTRIPAVGYVFFQGPLVDGAPTDVGTSYGQTYQGKKNLPLSSFAFYINGGPANLGDPDLGDYNGTSQLNYYQTGKDYYGIDFPTPFPFTGDPFRGKGDLDGRKFAPNDRRLMLSSGPFNMAPGDSQEIVTATIVAQGTVSSGSNYLASVSALKASAAEAQSAYSLNFLIPPPPAPPIVKTTSLNNRIVFDWSDSTYNTNYKMTEAHDTLGYEFEGYLIYQMPSASEGDLANGFNIASFDVSNGISIIRAKVFDASAGAFVVKPVKEFGNSGIIRSFSTDYDYINNKPLINNREYYYRVTAVSAYHPSDDAALGLGIATYLEGTTPTITVIPQEVPGERVNSTFGDTLTYSHPVGGGQGLLFVRVASPKDVTGADYNVIFEVDTVSSSPTKDELLYNIKNMSTNKLLYPSFRVQAKDGSGLNYEDVVEGLQIVVTGPALTFGNFEITANASGVLSPPSYGSFAFNGSGFPNPGPYQTAGTAEVNGQPDRPSSNSQVSGKLWGIHRNGGAGPFNTGSTSFIAGTTQYSGGNGRPNQGIIALIPDDYEFRFTGAAEKAKIYNSAVDFTVPFQVWNTKGDSDPSNDFRVLPGILDGGSDGVYSIYKADHALSGGDNDPQTDPIYLIEPLNRTAGEAGFNQLIADIDAHPTDWVAETAWAYYSGPDDFYAFQFNCRPALMRIVFVGFNLYSITDANWTTLAAATPYPETGTVFKVSTSKPNTVNDVYTFSTNGVTKTDALAKEDINKINVFPNPYFGGSVIEANRFARQVNFTHLPPKATIRIFSLAGAFVTKIDHTNGTQYDTWNLLNAGSLPVASGMYIIYIDSPSGTKILKLAVIQESQYLENI